MIQVASRKSQRAKKLTSAFTLIEMMVVIGIIAIVAGWAIPGLKRVYEDFKINETFDHIDTFISSLKAYYLVMSEFPPDTSSDYIGTEDAWCLPGNYYGRTVDNSRYRLAVKPYEAGDYDIDNWFNNNAHKQFYVSIYDEPVSDAWYVRFQERYPQFDIRREYSNHSLCLGFLPGLGNYATESVALRNRYY